MGAQSRKHRRASARSNVVSLDEARTAYLRTLADVAGLARPETGQRTPRPSVSRWDRGRLTELSLDRLTGILRKAEDGDTEELADLWLRMLKTDAHLHSVWESRTAPVYSARWETLPADVDPSRVALAKRAADGCGEAMRQVDDLPTVLAALLNARGVGFAVAEIVWRRGTLLGVPAWVPALIPIHSRRFRFSDCFEVGLYDDGRAVGALRKAGWHVDELQSRGACIARLPASKYVVHQPVGIHDYPTATGLVHSVARWWWVKQAVTKYWLSGAEMGANPRLIGKILQNAVNTTRDELHADLEALGGDGVIVLNEGVDVQIHEGKAKASSEVWDTLLKRMNAEMSKDVLGSTLNVEIDSSGGNRAASESQADITIRPRQQQDQAQMWASIKRDVFTWIVRFNPHLFPQGTPIPNGRSVLVEETAGIDQLAVDSGAVRVDELRSSRGLPLIGGEAGQAFINPITRSAAEAVTPSPQASHPSPQGPGQS
jgi:phage gp29-like protein